MSGIDELLDELDQDHDAAYEELGALRYLGAQFLALSQDVDRLTAEDVRSALELFGGLLGRKPGVVESLAQFPPYWRTNTAGRPA